MNLQQGRPGGDLEVVRRDPANGKELFRTGETEELKQYQLLGKPLPVGGMLYLPACKVNQTAELHVLAIQSGPAACSGRRMSAPISSIAARIRHAIKPTMLLSGTRLYVDTHAGGLVELASDDRAIRWAYNYPSKMPVQQRRWWLWGWDEERPESTFGPSGPLVVGGELFIKGMQSPRLFALRPDGSALDWKRAVPENAMLAGHRRPAGLSGRRGTVGLRPENAAIIVGQQPAGQIGLDRSLGDRAPLLPVHAARRFTSWIKRPAT